MKRILTLLLCFTLLIPVTYSQSNRPKSTTTQKKTSTSSSTKKSKPKSTSTASKPKTSVSPAPKKPRLFEGTLMYANMEYHSKAVMKYSYGMAYCGNRMQSITVSGNKAHVIDENMYLHTIIDTDANMCYLYSELTRSGVSFTLEEYRKHYSQLSDNSAYSKFTWQSSSKIQYKGDNLQTYHATISPKTEGSNLTGSLELWSSDAFATGNIFSVVFYGLNTHGIMKKWVWEMKSTAPIVGTLHSIVSSELIAMTEYSVPETVFQVPGDVTIVPETTPSLKNLRTMYKANRKAMKKMKLTPDEAVNDVLPQITNDWPFVKSVEQDENFTGNLGLELWSEVGRAVITSAVELTKEEMEKRRQERLEEQMLREAEEQQAMEAAAHEVQFVPRTQHNTTAKKAPSSKGKGNMRTPTGATAYNYHRTTTSSHNIAGEANRARILNEQRRAGAPRGSLTYAVLTEKDRQNEKYRQFMSKTYASPGTVFDSRLHIRCYNCRKYKGVCPACNGMGFYKKVYDRIVTPNGIIKNGTSDVPMKGTKSDCGVCKGHGECQACHGSGKGVGGYAGQDVKKSCPVCHGSKKCQSCHGKGYSTYYTPDETGECATIDESTQANRRTVECEVDCGQCGGNGVCTYCKGNRYITKLGPSSKCPMCDGSGDCYRCHGKKKTRYTARE